MSEGKGIALTPYTKSVFWVFRPIYNNTPTKLEWLLKYSMGWQIGVTNAADWGLDMARVEYLIWNFDSLVWESINKKGHFFFYSPGIETEYQYIGCWTKQAFYGVIEADVENYISDDGLVKVKLSFDVDCATGECEPQIDIGDTTHLSRNADLVTYYNGVIIT